MAADHGHAGARHPVSLYVLFPFKYLLFVFCQDTVSIPYAEQAVLGGMGEMGGKGGGRRQPGSGHLREGTGSIVPGLLTALPRLVVSRTCHHPHGWPGGSCKKGASFAGAQTHPTGLEVHPEGKAGWLAWKSRILLVWR